VYRAVQTGAKTQPGGAKKGLANEAYQTGTFGMVNIDPRKAAR